MEKNGGSPGAAFPKKPQIGAPFFLAKQARPPMAELNHERLHRSYCCLFARSSAPSIIRAVYGASTTIIIFNCLIGCFTFGATGVYVVVKYAQSVWLICLPIE